MKRTLLVVSVLLMFTGFAYAAGQLMGGNQPIQTFAPDGKLTVDLTVNKSTRNLTGKVLYSIYTPSATTCIFRVMSTTTRAGSKIAIPVTTHSTWAMNPSTPFLNLSGCTGGTLQLQ